MNLFIVFALICVGQISSMGTLEGIHETEVIPLQGGEIFTVSIKHGMVVAQIINQEYRAVGEESSVFEDRDATSVALYPSATRLITDDYIVVWSAVVAPAMEKEKIFGQLLSSNLQRSGKYFQMGQPKNNHYQLRPRVIAVMDGFIISWGFRNETTTGVSFQKFDNNAKPVGNEVLVHSVLRKELEESFTSETGILPSLTGSFDHSEFVITWQIERTISGRVYSANGAAVTETFIITDDSQLSRSVSVCAMRNEYILSWSNGNPLIQGFNSRGGLTGKVVKISSRNSTANGMVTCIPDVGFAPSFVSDLGLNDIDNGIYIRYFDEHHKPQTSDFLVANTHSHSDHSSILNSKGEVVIVWSASIREASFPAAHFTAVTATSSNPIVKLEYVMNFFIPNWTFAFIACIALMMTVKKAGFLNREAHSAVNHEGNSACAV